MRRITLLLAVVVAAIAIPVAFADNPQFNKGPSYTPTTSALTATGKATGLGNSPTQAFLTASQVDVYYYCTNKGNNFAPGHPATSSNLQGPIETIAPHNGQITFNVSLPAPVPSAADACPNKNWKVNVTEVDYLGVVLHIQQNGTDILTDGPNDFYAYG